MTTLQLGARNRYCVGVGWLTSTITIGNENFWFQIQKISSPIVLVKISGR
ncbi:MAG: hypothetical protein ACI9R3_005204 [Verrucomicrobiales bacterium]|jgi:hypothetical protein